MKLMKRIVSALVAVVLIVLLFPPKANAAETDTYYEEFGITYEQLFLYPQYLKSDKATQIIDSLKKSYFIPLESYSKIELWYASLVTALKEGGANVLAKEIASRFDLTESLEEEWNAEITEVLMLNILQAENLSEKASDKVAENFKKMKDAYDTATTAGRVHFVDELSTACSHLKDAQVEKIVDKAFKDADELMGFIDDGIEFWQVITGAIQLREMKAESICKLRDSLSENSDLAKALDKALTEMEKETVEHIWEHYFSKDIVRLLSKAIKGAMSGGLLTSGALVVAVADLVISVVLKMYQGATATDIYQTTILSQYVNEVKRAVESLKKDFRMVRSRDELVRAEDIDKYEYLYSMLIAILRETLESALSVAKDDLQKGNIEKAISLCETFNYDTYIGWCMEELKADIAAGVVETPEELVETGTTGALDLLTYEIIDSEVTITDCDTTVAGVFAIPSHIQGYPVRKIEDRAFYGCHDMTSIIIPRSVSSVEPGAFEWCKGLTSIEVDECNLYYSSDEQGILYNKDKTVLVRAPGKISSCMVPNGVVIIGRKAFYCCTELANVQIADSVMSIEDWVFSGCDALRDIVIPDGVISIGEYAFWGNDELPSVFIPASVTSIGFNAFGRSIVGAYEPIEVYITDPNKWFEGRFCEAFEEYTVHVIDTEGNEINEIILSGTITEVPRYAFSYFKNITKITIPDSVVSIGERSFWGCDSLISVSLPDSVTAIGKDAFSGCHSLTQLKIPNGVISIGEYAFSGCHSLTQLKIPNGVTSIEKGTFSGCYNLTDIHIPNSIMTIGEDAFLNCWALTNLAIPDSLTSIDFGAFHGCENLTSAILPEGLVSIGGWVFAMCESLHEVVIPKSVDEIGWNAFLHCSSLKEITYCGTATQLAAMKDSDYNFRNIEINYHDWECEIVKTPTYTSMGERVYTCSYCGEEIVETIPAKFYGTSVNMGNTLDMYFGFYTGLVDENGKVVFVREFADGTIETTEAPITAFNKNNSVYDITYTGLAAKEMCDVIHITVYNGAGQIVGEHSDSIRSYLLRQLREKEHEAEFRTLCIDLLNYGAAAQEAFGYDADDPANKDLTAEELAEGTQKVAEYADKRILYGVADSYYGTAYFLETQISMSMAVRADYFGENCYALVYYTNHMGAEKTNIRLEGVKNNSVYEFILNEIVVADGRCLLTIEFYNADGTKMLTVQDSMESYTARNAEGYPLAEKMLAFSDSAYKYLHRNDQ